MEPGIDELAERSQEERVATARADEAASNRDKVLEAAERVFAENGFEATVPAIAAAAGVGVGTIYRRFGPKDALITALVVERLQWFERLAADALGQPDAWDALCELLWTALSAQARDRVLSGAMALTREQPAVIAARERASAQLRRLIDRAREQGRLRPDVTADDVKVVMPAVGALIRDLPPESTAWRRLLGIVIDGLRVEGAHPLDEHPIAEADLEALVQRKG